MMRQQKVVPKVQTKPQPAEFDPAQYAYTGLSLDHILQIKKKFDLFDRDADGNADPKELKSALAYIGSKAQSKTVYQIVQDFDADGNGTFNFKQFLYLMSSKARTNNLSTASQQELDRIFNLLDDDKTGYISIMSLRRLIKQSGQKANDQQIQLMIKFADKDGDGMVSRKEFYELFAE